MAISTAPEAPGHATNRPDCAPADAPPLGAVELDPLELIKHNVQEVDVRVRRGGGWARIFRNTALGYFQQAGPRMAAALSYYSIVVGGPVLILTLIVGGAIFGEDATRQAVTLMFQRILPPADQANELARRVIHTSTPVAGLALLAGLGSLLGYTRALAASLNVAMKAEGSEPFRRTFVVGPLLLVTVIGLLWAAWALDLAIDMVELATGEVTSRQTKLIVAGVAPLILAMLSFAIILKIVPRASLAWREVLIPAIFGAVLWEAARHIFGWTTGGESLYVRVFGPLGGVVALLFWVYVSNAILILTGQFTWAYAMERRGRGRLAGDAPRLAGLDGRIRPFDGDNAVNEDHPA